MRVRRPTSTRSRNDERLGCRSSSSQTAQDNQIHCDGLEHTYMDFNPDEADDDGNANSADTSSPTTSRPDKATRIVVRNKKSSSSSSSY